jgi:hypothetical protein
MDQPRRCFLSGRVLSGLPVRVAVFRFRRHGDLFRTFFEHLGAETEARAFLLECLRCLQSQGVIRLVVPDAWAYLRAYSGRRQCHRWLPSSVPGAKKNAKYVFSSVVRRLPKSGISQMSISALDLYSRFIGGKFSPYFQSNHGSSKPRHNRGTKVRGCANNRQNHPRKTRSAQSGIAI